MQFFWLRVNIIINLLIFQNFLDNLTFATTKLFPSISHLLSEQRMITVALVADWYEIVPNEIDFLGKQGVYVEIELNHYCGL